MLISYGRPDMSFVMSGGDAAFITPADGSALVNGRPADVQRIQWRSSPINTGSGGAVTITAELGDSSSGETIKARCCALLMPNLSTAIPAGVKVTFAGTLSGSPVVLGGNAITTRTQLLPNGATAIWCVFPAATIDTLVVTIYNDKNGATWATASEIVDLGELWCGLGADFNVANDVRIEWHGGILQRRSHNNQAWPLLTQAFRQLNVQLVPMTEDIAIGPNSNQDDYETVASAISTQACCVLIPSYFTRGPVNGNAAPNGEPPPVIGTGTISVQRLHRTAVLGVLGGESGQPISTQVNGDVYYVSPIVFGESPP
jgi:hypothetical protein